MQYIKKSDCPKLLAKNQEQWTAPWVAHYRWQKGISTKSERPKKPSGSRWLRDKIRLPLISDFHNNCGYCGESIPTPQAVSKQRRASKGDVDHFLPKSIKPELVYEWTNFIWSCKPCNQQKDEFFNENYPLLNPCSQDDCIKLVFLEDTGQYDLHSTVSKDSYWSQRLKNSELKTMLNSDEICQKRRFKISMLHSKFTSIAKYLELIQLSSPNIVNDLKGFISSDIAKIFEITKSPDFYLLVQEQYQCFLQEYPRVAEELLTQRSD